MPRTNTAVGRRKAFALAAIPLMLTAVSIPSTASEINRLCGAREGNAETSAATPAATDTATVRV